MRRMLISCKTDGAEFFALNDIVVKSASTRPVSTELYVDGTFCGRLSQRRCHSRDSYGLHGVFAVGGGPVLAPELSALVVNAVCPHTLHGETPRRRGRTRKVEIRVIGGGEAQLVVDGTAAGGSCG